VESGLDAVQEGLANEKKNGAIKEQEILRGTREGMEVGAQEE